MNNLIHTQHLPSGAPTSLLLAFLANYKIFSTLQETAEKHGCIMSVYVDDISFSCISHKTACLIRKETKNLLRQNGYDLSIKKSRIISPGKTRIITGIAIKEDGSVQPTNKNFKHWRELKQKDYERYQKSKEGIHNYINSVYSMNNRS